jgi:hypothetical protein
MEAQVLEWLNSIPLPQIQQYVLAILLNSVSNVFHRYTNSAVHFMDGYQKGLTGAEAVWVMCKYHGYHVLPSDIMDEVKKVSLYLKRTS